MCPDGPRRHSGLLLLPQLEQVLDCAAAAAATAASVATLLLVFISFCCAGRPPCRSDERTACAVSASKGIDACVSFFQPSAGPSGLAAGGASTDCVRCRFATGLARSGLGASLVTWKHARTTAP